MSTVLVTRTRLTLDLSKRINDTLLALADKYGKTKAGVIRLALELLLEADMAKEEGFHVGAWKDVSAVFRERIFPC